MSLWGNKPTVPGTTPKLPPKPVPQPVVKPGFLENKFRKQDELIGEVKKHSYFKDIPTYGKKFSQNERVALIKELEKKSGGVVGGLSDNRMNIAIKKLEKEKMTATYHKEFGKIKQLDQKIKQAKVWKKAW